jgi:hypothetical protein
MPGMWKRAEASCWPIVMASMTMALRMSLFTTSLLSGMGGALMVTRSWYSVQFK